MHQQPSPCPCPCPLPPIPTLTLPPPTLTSYEYCNKLKHLLLLNGQQYNDEKEELTTKYKNLIDKCQKNSLQSESNGQKMEDNPDDYFLCGRCQRKVLKDQMSIHLSCHAAVILDNLLLGDKISAQSYKELVERNKVTHVVNAACELPNHFEKRGIEYCKLELLDQPDQEIGEAMEQAYQFIKASHEKGGIVFVHCAVGKSRSVSVILTYLLRSLGIGIKQGLKMVKEKRPVAQPNIGYMKQLLAYEAQHSSTTSQLSASS